MGKRERNTLHHHFIRMKGWRDGSPPSQREICLFSFSSSSLPRAISSKPSLPSSRSLSRRTASPPLKEGASNFDLAVGTPCQNSAFDHFPPTPSLGPGNFILAPLVPEINGLLSFMLAPTWRGEEDRESIPMNDSQVLNFSVASFTLIHSVWFIRNTSKLRLVFL